MDKRQQMVDEIAHKYGLSSPKVFSAMRKIPREKFVERKYQFMAYRDGPVPCGFEQTMSQPFTVAFMTDLLKLSGKERVLEIGTGSGYQAAVLSKLAKEVYTIEIIGKLAKKAKERLKRLGYKNVYVKTGSGEKGWKAKAPFDAILITAGIEGNVPKILIEQLKKGGVLVAPVGKGYDKIMTRYTKIVKRGKEKIEKEKFGIFHFVPFIKK